MPTAEDASHERLLGDSQLPRVGDAAHARDPLEFGQIVLQDVPPCAREKLHVSLGSAC